MTRSTLGFNQGTNMANCEPLYHFKLLVEQGNIILAPSLLNLILSDISFYIG